MGEGVTRARFVADGHDEFEATPDGHDEPESFWMPKDAELRWRVDREISPLEAGDLIDITQEYEQYTVVEVKALELDPRHLLQRIRDIEAHIGLNPRKPE